ncbi:MAG: NAD(P)-dependent dehydrogenase (short-subunit alcohol dehydrogenase family) [Halioglobus sp.]|jgi:NAD(P)-dependent dehydrogenase (short-subunit alcohol dehydrogenase family)
MQTIGLFMTNTSSQLTRNPRNTVWERGCLQLPLFNAVIVGNGAMGTALLQALLENPGLHRIAVLGRAQKAPASDPRVIYIHMDAEQPDSIERAATATRQEFERCHLLINTVGMLHTDTHKPEKRLRDVTAECLQKSFAINAILLPLLAQAFGPLLKHSEPAVFASLSARVGSIEDNQLGGWYSYRTAKAAHNMLLRTISREWSLSYRNVSVVALHPGTVESALSAPFISKSYSKRVLTAKESGAALIAVIDKLRPGQSGDFYDWQGTRIPW